MEQSVRRQFFFFRIERVRRRVRYRCDELVETNRSIARSFGLLRVRASTEPSKMVLLPLSAFFFYSISTKKIKYQKTSILWRLWWTPSFTAILIHFLLSFSGTHHRHRVQGLDVRPVCLPCRSSRTHLIERRLVGEQPARGLNVGRNARLSGGPGPRPVRHGRTLLVGKCDPVQGERNSWALCHRVTRRWHWGREALAVKRTLKPLTHIFNVFDELRLVHSRRSCFTFRCEKRFQNVDGRLRQYTPCRQLRYVLDCDRLPRE